MGTEIVHDQHVSRLQSGTKDFLQKSEEDFPVLAASTVIAAMTSRLLMAWHGVTFLSLGALRFRANWAPLITSPRACSSINDKCSSSAVRTITARTCTARGMEMVWTR